jgi:hypothetical protein
MQAAIVREADKFDSIVKELMAGKYSATLKELL